ncbi:MAG: hypothetical protein ACREMZ_03140 [Gemmatimonadales bacterium]
MSVRPFLPSTGTVAALVCATALGCDAPARTEPTQPRPAFNRPAEFQTVTFVVGPLSPSFETIEVLGNGRRHFRGGTLPGPVGGDLAGNFVAHGEITFDATFTGQGHGTATISTAEGDWAGNLVMKFEGILVPALGRYVPLGWFQLTLQGPQNKKLFAECQERMPPTSETLDCVGTIVAP